MMKNFKHKVLFGLPILAALSALPRAAQAQAQEEIRINERVSLKLVEDAQVACTKEVIAPLWKAAFGRDLSKEAKTDFYQSLQSSFKNFTVDLSDGGNRVYWNVGTYETNLANSSLDLTLYRDNPELPIADLVAKNFPIVTFDIPEDSPYDSLGNPISKDFILKNVRIILNAKLTPRQTLKNRKTEKMTQIGIDTASYFRCLLAQLRQ